jgi:hypothetical protein
MSNETKTAGETAKMAERVRGDVESSNLSEYEKVARAFLEETGAKFTARYLGAFDSAEEWGEEPRGVRGLIPVWRVSISTASGRMSVRFRGSIIDGQNGRTGCGVYDVLSALMKSEPGEFDDFACDFGYFPISSAAEYRRARRVWAACVREWRGVCRVWPSEAERAKLGEIN